MKRLWLVGFLIIVSSFVFAYSSVTPDPGHDGNNIFVTVNGQERNLQELIDTGKFDVRYGITGLPGSSVAFGHIGAAVFVRVNNTNRIFQEAINDGSLCSFSGGSGSYSDDVVFGHKGEDIFINFSVGVYKNLQQAINDGDFFACPTTTYSCTGSIPNGAERHDSEEESGLTANKAWAYSLTDTSVKCQYECSSGYVRSGSSCVAATYTCTGSMPSGAERHDSEEESSLTANKAWAYSLTDTSVKCQYECSSGYVRSGSSCVAACDNSCEGKQCGVNDCGNSCGTCAADAWAENDWCSSTGDVYHSWVDWSCSDNECSYTSTSTLKTTCSSSEACIGDIGSAHCDAGSCDDSCEGKQCGVNDCGNSCGTCAADAWAENDWCSGGDVYHSWVDWSCSDNECSYTPTSTLKTSCSSSEACIGATGSAHCDAGSVNYQAEKRCYENDVWYYDSTGKKSNKAEECGSVDDAWSGYSYRNVCYDAKAEGDCSGDDCYEAECGVCRYDPGMVCMTGKDGYKITPSCVDRPRYLWYDSTGMAGLWGQGGTFGYYNDLNLISVPKFVIGIVYYEVKGRLEWRGESLGGSWYEVCETNNIVS